MVLISDEALLIRKTIKPAWVNPKEMDAAFREMLFFPRLTGICIFNSNIKLSIVSVMRSTATYAIYLISGVFKFTLTSAETRTEKAFVLILNLGLVIANIADILWSASNIHYLRKIKREFQWLERILRWHGLNWFWRPNKFFQILALCLPLTISLVHAYACETVLLSIFDGLWYLIGVTMVYVKVDLFISFLSLIRSIEAKITSLADSQVILHCQECIFSVGGYLNKVFGPLHVLYFTCMFVPILYYLYKFFAQGTLIYFFWAISGAVPILQSIISSHLTALEINKLNKMIYGRMLAQPDDETLDFHLTARREFVFSASGFFDLDNSLICSMIGAGTTYLVILLQYSGSPPPVEQTVQPTNQTLS